MNLSLEVDHENYYSFVVKEDADVFALQLSPGRPNCPIELREYLLLSNSSPQVYWFFSSLKKVLDIWSSGGRDTMILLPQFSQIPA
nr:hypothetical protein CFP56_16137 [Quercus suber]